MNFSARMETTGQPGRLQVTAAVAARLTGSMTLRVAESARKHIKGKGDAMVHFVERVGGVSAATVVTTIGTSPEQHPRSISAELAPPSPTAAFVAIALGTAAAPVLGLGLPGAGEKGDPRQWALPPAPGAFNNPGDAPVSAYPPPDIAIAPGGADAPFQALHAWDGVPEGQKPHPAAPPVSNTLAEVIVAEAGRVRRRMSFSHNGPVRGQVRVGRGCDI